MVSLSHLCLRVKRFQEPQCSIVEKISQISTKFNAEKVFSKDFAIALQDDAKAISDYASEMQHGKSTARDAFEVFMSNASAEAQMFAKANKEAIKQATLWEPFADKFKQQARLDRLGESTASSFEGAVNAIRLYNEGTEKAGFTTEEFRETVAKFNPELEAYISMMDTKGKKPTEFGYWKLTHKATVETAIFTASITAGTAALGLFAQKGNTTAAQVVGGLTAVGGAIAGVVGAIQLAKGALGLTTGFGIISAGISAVIAGISAFQTASARMREAWQADIDQLEQFKQSSEELTEAYTNVSKYLTALQNGEDVGDDLNDAVTALNKALGDNKVQFDEASMSAEEYAKRVAKASKEALQGALTEAKVSEDSAAQMLKSKMPLGGLVGSSVPVKRKDDAVVNEILSKYLSGYFYELGGRVGGTDLFGNREGTLVVKKGKTTDETANNILDYYNGLVEARKALSAKEKSDNNAWKVLSSEITKYESAVEDLIDARYQVAKLEYEAQNGIPTTKEEYDRLTASLRNVAAATGSQYLMEQMLIKANEEFAKTIKGINGEIKAGGESGRVALKSVLDILGEVQDGYDGLSDALKEMSEQGYLSADSLETLYQLQKDNKLAGLDLTKVIKMTANGYQLAGDALQQFVNNLIKSYSQYEIFATATDKQNAIKNLQNLRAVLITLRNTQMSSGTKKNTEKDALEAQKDALDDQLDAYKKLIELRKKLLKSYEDEQNYQKNLEKKQKKVADLQMQLALSKLDTSEAGRAKTREIADELETAGDDLNDFTIDHTIEKLTTDLDAQYSEYESFIDGRIKDIENAINNIDTGSDIDLSWLDGAIKNTDDILTQLKEPMNTIQGDTGTISGNITDGRGELRTIDGDVATGNGFVKDTLKVLSGSEEGGSSEGGIKGDTANISANGTSIGGKIDSASAIISAAIDGIKGAPIAPNSPGSASDTSSAPDIADLAKKAGAIAASATLPKAGSGTAGSILSGAMSALEGMSGPLYSKSAFKTDAFLLSKYGTYSNYLLNGDPVKDEEERKRWHLPGGGGGKYRTMVAAYHSGGVVGGAFLDNNEEFAKLMKGEFVSTPAMMKRFMNQTLPSMAAATREANEFNAPLITINCDNITSEAIPKLEEVVNNAVDRIKKELDGGMSRNGYRQPVKKLLI